LRLSPHPAQAAQTPLSQDALLQARCLGQLHDTPLKTTPVPLNPAGYAGSRQQSVRCSICVCSLFYELLFRCPRQLSRDERPDGSLPAFAWDNVPFRRFSRYRFQVQPLSNLLPAGFRFLRHPIPAAPSARLAAHFPRGRTTGLPRSARVPTWVRSLLYTGGAPSAIDAA
jgi:hypothetical protein